MKGLLSTGASRAWFGVALVGLVVVALVLALTLFPRLGAGQRVIDAAEPAFADERVDGHAGGRRHASRSTSTSPIRSLTARGGRRGTSARSSGSCAASSACRAAQVRKILRREAPHTEALTRALPLDGVAAEIPRADGLPRHDMAMTEEELAATAGARLPAHLAVADGAAERRRRLVRRARHRRADAAARRQARAHGAGPAQVLPRRRRAAARSRTSRTSSDLAGLGGIGYIPYLLLVVGVALLAYGLLRPGARERRPPGKLLVGRRRRRRRRCSSCSSSRAQYFPRLGGAQRAIDRLRAGVRAGARARRARTASTSIHEAIAFGDPIMTAARRRRARGAAAVPLRRRSAPAARPSDVRGALRRRAPQTTRAAQRAAADRGRRRGPAAASATSRAALRMPARQDRRATLRRRTPALAQALLTRPTSTAGWNAIPGTRRADPLRRRHAGAHDAASSTTTCARTSSRCSPPSARTSNAGGHVAAGRHVRAAAADRRAAS